MKKSHKAYKRIWIVEDDPLNRFLLRKILSITGLSNTVVEFENGQKAIDALSDLEDHGENPELILLDLNMPVANGWDFLEAYSETANSREAPVFIVTSSIDPMDKIKALNYPCVKRFVHKPVFPGDLI